MHSLYGRNNILHDFIVTDELNLFLFHLLKLSDNADSRMSTFFWQEPADTFC